MRTTLLAALIAGTCLWPALTQAQTSSGGGMRGASPGTRGSSGATFRPGPPRSPGRPSNSARPIVPPAPPSAPPIGPYASPSALDRGDIFRAGPRTYAPQYSRSRGFYYGGYGGGYGTAPMTDTSPIHLATSASPIPRRRQSIAICAGVRIKKAICVSRSNPRAPRCSSTASMPAPSPNSAAAAGEHSTPDHIASNSGLRDTTRRASSCGSARMTSSRIGARSPDATNVRSFAPQPDHPRRFT